MTCSYPKIAGSFLLSEKKPSLHTTVESPSMAGVQAGHATGIGPMSSNCTDFDILPREFRIQVFQCSWLENACKSTMISRCGSQERLACFKVVLPRFIPRVLVLRWCGVWCPCSLYWFIFYWLRTVLQCSNVTLLYIIFLSSSKSILQTRGTQRVKGNSSLPFLV